MRRFILCTAFAYLVACTPSVEKETAAVKDTIDHTNTDSSIAPNNRDTIQVHKLIVAGQSIGLTNIGQTAAEISALLGKPDEGDAAMGKSLSTWYSKNHPEYKTQVFCSIYFGADEDQPRVKSIRVNNPFFETSSGLKAGSHWKDIEKEFPGLLLVGSYTQGKGKVKVFDDVVKGIAFEINEESICVGICVHSREEKGFLQYLPFENNFKVADN